MHVVEWFGVFNWKVSVRKLLSNLRHLCGQTKEGSDSHPRYGATAVVFVIDVVG